MTDKILGFSPTDEQLAIADAAKLPDSIMVPAYAGCTKTTTLQLAGRNIKVPALALAFNKKIVKELEPRFAGNFSIKTLNGLGHGAWARSGNITSITLDEKKLGKIVSQIARDRKVELSSDNWDDLRRLVSAAMQAGVSPDNIGEPLTVDTRESWSELADSLWLSEETFEFLYEMARDILAENIKLARQGIISFDDQIYCPTILGGKWAKFPVVLVDEAQDLSPLNHRMLALSQREDGKMLVVGDEKQCHPPGTMIQCTGGIQKPIEDVCIGQQLVSYNRKVGFSGVNYQGRRVVDKKIFQFDGELVRINTYGPFAQDCTPNHRCLVKWENKQGYAVYLMQQGNRFRIETAQCWYSSKANGGFGPAMRARQEKADALWVLKVCPTKEEALIEEKVIWTMFGLPDLIFHCSGKLSSTQRHLDAAWDAIGDNSKRALLCLKKFGRLIEFPLWTRETHKHIEEKKFITEACNLIENAMTVKVFDGSENCETWLDFTTQSILYSGPVYGLTVEPNGFGMSLYVANGIVTHNSIYAFRGADSDSMNKVRSLKATWKTLPLTMTFRCPKSVVARQQPHAPGFRAASSNPDGQVVRFEDTSDPEEKFADGWSWGWDDVLKLRPTATSEIMVLCRNNGPLMAMAFKLLRRGVGVVMLGRDIGKGLDRLSRQISPDDSTPIDLFAGKLLDWENHESSLARANGKEEKVAGITDRAECLRSVISNAGILDAGGLRVMLKKLFSRETGSVTLSSIHRAKGLEFDLVLHLDYWRIPSKFAKQAALQGDDRQLVQEKNLRYVAETRAKHTFIEASLEDFQ